MHLEFHTSRALLLIVASIGLQCMAAEPNSSATLTVHVDQPGALISTGTSTGSAAHLGHGILRGCVGGRGLRRCPMSAVFARM